MKTSIIKKSEIFNNFDIRIDAEYFDPEYLQENFLIDNKGWLCFSDKNVKGGKRLPKGCRFSQEGIPYIRAEDIKNGFVEYENSPKISEELSEKLHNYRTTYNDVLVTIVGNSIGDIGIVKFELEKCNLTENCAKIINLSSINMFPEYLYTFLKSKYGQGQINREKVGTAQPKLALTRIRKFKIPKLSNNMQLLIKELIDKSYNFGDLAKVNYGSAQQFLNNEIDINNFKINSEKYFIKSLSKSIRIANRFDSEYFNPKYDKIINHVKNMKNDILNNHFEIIKNNNNKYAKAGEVGVLKTKQIKNHFLDYCAEDNLFYDIKTELLEDRDILFASMGVGSLGRTNIYYKFENDKNYTVDSTIKIFRAKQKGFVSPELLEVYLHSNVAQELIYQNIVGSSGIISIYESYLQNLPIPIINKNVEEQIIKNVHNAHLFNFQSKQLLEIAKRGVEIAIEESEEVATSWINEQLSKIGVEI